MRILILDDASEGLAAIESAIQGHEIEIRRADAVEPISGSTCLPDGRSRRRRATSSVRRAGGST